MAVAYQVLKQTPRARNQLKRISKVGGLIASLQRQWLHVSGCRCGHDAAQRARVSPLIIYSELIATSFFMLRSIFFSYLYLLSKFILHILCLGNAIAMAFFCTA